MYTTTTSFKLKEYIRLFTPAWHAIVMGTGAVTILFNVFPYGSQHHGLQVTALCFLFLNIIFFLIITSLTLARYILFPRLWRAMLLHPTQSLFLGCFPMGFATIIMSALGVVHNYFGVGGRGFVLSLWAMWWVDVVVGVIMCFGQLQIMFTCQTHSLSCMTLVWLLPIVIPIVTSAAGAVVAQSLISINLSYVYLTLGACMLLATIGILLALAVITIYILRLVVYKVPRGVAVFSVFLPLGPLGQAGFTYVVLGEVAGQVFPLQLADTGSENILASEHAGEILNLLAWILGFALWSFATCWVVLASLVLAGVLRKSVIGKAGDEVVPFKVTFWGMIFPNGVYANLTIHLASSIDSQILRVWGAIYACFTISLWLFALMRTVNTLKDGSVFEELAVGVQEVQDTEAAGTDSVPRRSSFLANRHSSHPALIP